eukprot:UN23428
MQLWMISTKIENNYSQRLKVYRIQRDLKILTSLFKYWRFIVKSKKRDIYATNHRDVNLATKVFVSWKDNVKLCKRQNDAIENMNKDRELKLNKIAFAIWVKAYRTKKLEDIVAKQKRRLVRKRCLVLWKAKYIYFQKRAKKENIIDKKHDTRLLQSAMQEWKQLQNKYTESHKAIGKNILRKTVQETQWAVCVWRDTLQTNKKHQNAMAMAVHFDNYRKKCLGLKILKENYKTGKRDYYLKKISTDYLRQRYINNWKTCVVTRKFRTGQEQCAIKFYLVSRINHWEKITQRRRIDEQILTSLNKNNNRRYFGAWRGLYQHRKKLQMKQNFESLATNCLKVKKIQDKINNRVKKELFMDWHDHTRKVQQITALFHRKSCKKCLSNWRAYNFRTRKNMLRMKNIAAKNRTKVTSGVWSQWMAMKSLCEKSSTVRSRIDQRRTKKCWNIWENCYNERKQIKTGLNKLPKIKELIKNQFQITMAKYRTSEITCYYFLQWIKYKKHKEKLKVWENNAITFNREK